ncbi:MAG: hypothetical protein EPO52_16575 [Herbiconiux sp.]|uniref:hypothetical protein n=1 Tax=Herbiconiux sp. TaxID=1871186 RepID=UPI0011F79FBF|nr:hypothetical protein [Herbiconiux sp.]TAJ46162.1 MAG: hypothetical protein EPO52_16575 [Herbiconiux sp.]
MSSQITAPGRSAQANAALVLGVVAALLGLPSLLTLAVFSPPKMTEWVPALVPSCLLGIAIYGAPPYAIGAFAVALAGIAFGLVALMRRSAARCAVAGIVLAVAACVVSLIPWVGWALILSGSMVV